MELKNLDFFGKLDNKEITKLTCLKFFSFKLTKCGKKSVGKTLFTSILTNLHPNKTIAEILLTNSILKILTPLVLEKKYIGHLLYTIPKRILSKTAILKSISYLFKITKTKKNNYSFGKNLSDEIKLILKNQGKLLEYKKMLLKKAISNRMFVHLLHRKYKIRI